MRRCEKSSHPPATDSIDQETWSGSSDELASQGGSSTCGREPDGKSTLGAETGRGISRVRGVCPRQNGEALE